MSVSETVQLIYELKDGVSETASKMGQSASSASDDVDGLESSASSASSSMSKLDGDMERTSGNAKQCASQIRSDSDSAGASVRSASSAVDDLKSTDTSAIGTVKASADSAKGSVDGLGASLDSSRIKVTTQLTALMGLKEATSNVISGIVGLGLVSDDTAQDLMKVNSAFSLLSGVVTGVKALQAAFTGLNVAQAINNALSTFGSVLRNPAALAGVAVATGAALGVAGAYLMTNDNSTSTTNTTITIQDTSEQKDIADQVYSIIGGGAL